MNKYDFMERLESCWEKYPSLRFGQFVNNALAVMKSDGQDPFFVEDDEMIQFFEKYTQK